MTGAKRAFGKERHGGLKLAIAGVAIASFGAVWAALGASNNRADATAEATAQVGRTAGGGTIPSSPASRPTATARPRQSRGS